MDEGSEVQFQVRAENEAGVGDPSEPTEILTIEDPTSKILSYIVENSNGKNYVCAFIASMLIQSHLPYTQVVLQVQLNGVCA